MKRNTLTIFSCSFRLTSGDSVSDSSTPLRTCCTSLSVNSKDDSWSVAEVVNRFVAADFIGGPLLVEEKEPCLLEMLDVVNGLGLILPSLLLDEFGGGRLAVVKGLGLPLLLVLDEKAIS